MRLPNILHIVMFSGGAASSVMAKIVADANSGQTILLHTPTGAEHPDADRFRAQVAAYIGLPITIEAANFTLWDLVNSRKHIPNDGLPYCTKELKLIPQDRYLTRLKKAGQDFISYVGYDRSERGRIQKTFARHEAKGRKVKFPLAEASLTSDECKRIIREDWRICLPEPYQYLKHNNCIPCYRGGEAHWYNVWRYYPEQFMRAARAEERADNTVFADKSLLELVAIWEDSPLPTNLFEGESIPCMCAI